MQKATPGAISRYAWSSLSFAGRRGFLSPPPRPDELGTHTDDSAGRAEHVTRGDEQRAVLVDGDAAGHDQRPRR